MPFDPTKLKLIQSRDELPKESAKVGQAVYDMLSKKQDSQDVGETLEAITPDYLDQLKDTIKNNIFKYESPFYVVVLGKKEPWAVNVVRHWFIARQTLPLAPVLMNDYPNHFQEVYKYDASTGDCSLMWSLPARWAHTEIMNHPESYHPQLVEWVFDLYNQKGPAYAS